MLKNNPYLLKTVFEINKTSVSQPSALIMRKKRLQHDKVVCKFKSHEYLEENISLFQKNMYSVQNDVFKRDEDDEEEEDEENEDQSANSFKQFSSPDFEITVTNHDGSSGISDKTKSKSGLSKKAEKRKRPIDTIDKENFIPYKPKNFQTEKG